MNIYYLEWLKRTALIPMGWKLLEHRVLYYLWHSPIITDCDYDQQEREYIKLCRLANIKESFSTTVGVNQDSPSVQLIINKLRGAQWD